MLKVNKYAKEVRNQIQLEYSYIGIGNVWNIFCSLTASMILNLLNLLNGNDLKSFPNFSSRPFQVSKDEARFILIGREVELAFVTINRDNFYSRSC